MGVKEIFFLVGMILGALLSYFAKPISQKTGKEEIKIKVAGLLICLLFAALLFTLS